MAFARLTRSYLILMNGVLTIPSVEAIYGVNGAINIKEYFNASYEYCCLG